MDRRALILTPVAISLAACASPGPSPETVPYPRERFVILTADDYGASDNIDEGIEIALSHGAVTAVSALTSFPSSHARLRELADRFPGVGIGVHCNLTTGFPLIDPRLVPSLVGADGAFMAVDVLLSRVRTVSLAELELELRAQVRALEELGIRLDHLSDHNGVLSLYPPFFEVFCRIAREAGVPVRSPLSASLKFPRLFPDAGIRRKGKEVARRAAGRNPFGALALLPSASLAGIEKRVARLDGLGIPHPEVLIDYLYGNPTTETAMRILRSLPVRVSEIVLHLGTSTRSGTYPPGLDVGYFDARERELAVATSASPREYAGSLNVRAVGFAEAVSLLGRSGAP